MSTPADSFPEEESQHNKRAEDHSAPTLQQPAEQADQSASLTGVDKEPTGVQTTPRPAPSALPPEAEGETNGGPLGCCLGVTVGLVLSLSVALFSRFYADPLAHVFSSSLSLVVRIVMILILLVAVSVCGYFGWKIGKIAYREYDPPVVKDRRKRKTRPSTKSRQA